MNEPDPVRSLAAQLEELRDQLARQTGDTGQLHAKITEDSGQVPMLRLEIRQLGEKIDAAIVCTPCSWPVDEPQACGLGNNPGASFALAGVPGRYLDRALSTRICRV